MGQLLFERGERRGRGGSGSFGTTAQEDEELEVLEEEAEALIKSLKKGKLVGEEVSAEMIEQVRGLIRAFGIPYVDSPGEAEAQASYLVQTNQAEAVMSDDSDCLVFGCSHIFRNFFLNDKHVELFTLKEVETTLGLKLEDLRALALLLGCDYTLGVRGIGIVNALEVIAAFGSSLAALNEFALWARDLAHITSAGIKDSDTPTVKHYKQKHFNFRAQWDFPRSGPAGSFPSLPCLKAFEKPKVDRSLEPFSWAPMDPSTLLTIMVKWAQHPENQTRAFLDPVLAKRRRVAPARQTLISQFFAPVTPNEAVAVYRSERLKKAASTILSAGLKIEQEDGQELGQEVGQEVGPEAGQDVGQEVVPNLVRIEGATEERQPPHADRPAEIQGLQQRPRRPPRARAKTKAGSHATSKAVPKAALKKGRSKKGSAVEGEERVAQVFEEMEKEESPQS